MLNNIVDNLEQCGQHNIVQCCFHQARTGCAFFAVYTKFASFTNRLHVTTGRSLRVWRCYLTFSLSVSKAEVASSSSNILGSRINALAMAILCFCPPDIRVPLSPTIVS